MPEYSREQRDLALAALLLRSGTLSEPQLQRALGSWTIHGSMSLGNHLVRLGLIDESSLEEFSEQVTACLETCPTRSLRATATSETMIGSTLEALDPSGKLARMMGVRSAAGKNAIESIDRREALLGYRLVRKIGQGGLGIVWLAYDENLKRHVAIKEISGRDNPATLERFRREAEITGQLEHPGIVPIYQLGNDERSNEAFYAMRFLGKSTLHDSIMEYHERRGEGDDNPMLIRQLLTDFVNVCQAIGHAHSHKVIHRDLKPENVAIDSFGQVIVIDWGIAKILDDVTLGDATADINLNQIGGGSTLQGQVLGTPLYMSPEQAAGRVDELDQRTDIYGLGAILFAILTGSAPHEKVRVASEGSGGRELLSAIASQPTPNALEVNRDTDEALAAICAKAMARKQYARYQSATQLADDVQRWMAGEPVSAYAERPSQRVARWIQTHRIMAQVIAALMIVSVVALVTAAVAARQNAVAERSVLFDEMGSYEREIEVQLKSTATGLTKDARFMSTLPPIQGIIQARAGTESNEGEEVWRGRLETIYEGSLRANPAYLTISYAAVDRGETDGSAIDQAGSDLVRVERHISDVSFVRRVPESRLGAFDDVEVMRRTAALSPGDILLMIRRRSDHDSMLRSEVRLVASTPVFDETSGELFGIVAIEMDLLGRIVEFLERVGQTTANIYITDDAGNVWVSDDPETGVDIKHQVVAVTKFIPGLSEFLSNTDQSRQLDRRDGWVSKRFTLDRANPQTEVAVVMELIE